MSSLGVVFKVCRTECLSCCSYYEVSQRKRQHERPMGLRSKCGGVSAQASMQLSGEQLEFMVESAVKREAGTWRRRSRIISLYRRRDDQGCRNALQQDANTQAR